MEELLYITGPRMVPDKGTPHFFPFLEELVCLGELRSPFALFGGPFSILSPSACAQSFRTLRPPAPGAPELLLVTDDGEALLSLIKELSGQRDLCLFANEVEIAGEHFGQLACYSLLEPFNLIVEQCSCPMATKLFVKKHGFEKEADDFRWGILQLQFALVFNGLEKLEGTSIKDLLVKTFRGSLVEGVYSSRVLWEMAKEV